MMMRLKKLAALVMAVVMALALSVPAFAANTNAHTITITNTKTGHTYEAYQVFAGDITGGKLTNIEWGKGVDGDALLTELKTLDAYKNCNSAEDVAGVLAGFGDNASELDAFAEIANKHLSGTVAGTSSEEQSSYTIDVNGDGYYLIIDEVDSVPANDAYTKIILKVVGDVTVEAKADSPSIDKIIVNADDGEGDGTAQDVGSVVNFQVNSTVPEMDGYETYRYVVTDTMSAGLTFKGDVVVKIGETVLDAEKDYTLGIEGQTFVITISDLTKYDSGSDIVITYSATINANALNTDVETNTIGLEYSNNPNGAGMGETPGKTVYVYDFDIVIDKYADGNVSKKLSGAVFVLKNDDGKYYKLANNVVAWVDSEDDATKIVTDENGFASFVGVDSGTYTLIETEAPAGYNKLDETTVTITAVYGEDGQLVESSAVSVDKGQYEQTISVENKSGATLPSTGGMGTTILYAVGTILVLGAGIALVVKRRMAASK